MDKRLRVMRVNVPVERLQVTSVTKPIKVASPLQPGC